MTIRIDPRWPLVWRDPSTLQVGIDPPRVIIERVTILEERLISALTVGVTHDGLEVIAEGNHPVIVELITRLTPVLQAPVPRSIGATVALSGVGRLVELVARLLGEVGIRVVVAERAEHLVELAPALAIVVGHDVLAPQLHSVWLRRDVPHVPVLFTESAVHLGPIVEPGTGPCLVCIELHRRDADAAWPTIATQLLTRAVRNEPPLLAAGVAVDLCRVVLERLERGPRDARSLRISVTGERTATEWDVHPECSCRGLGLEVSRALTGTGSASAKPSLPRNQRPTTEPASAGHA